MSRSKLSLASRPLFNSTMDLRSTYLAGRKRSRNSPSPSSSHSDSAPASSTHSLKLASENHLPPPPASSSGPLTSNSRVSRSGYHIDQSDEGSADDVVEGKEDYLDNDSSIRSFTAARLNNGGASASTDNQTVKIENYERGNDGLNSGGTDVMGLALGATGSSVSRIVSKDDTTKIATETVHTSGAYIAREESLKREEEAGFLKFVCLSNDGIDEHMVWLIGLKNIFARQLPNMPKEYIVRLVMDRSHKSVMVIRSNRVVGGITYRPYISQKFGEIAFCAITSDEQVKGYGTRLMNHLKNYARNIDGLTHFLTYADNNAVGYFKKQGFSADIQIEKGRWQGYIKDYDGGLLMECKIDPKLAYTDLSTMIRRQREAIDEKIRELSNCYIVYSGIDFQKKEAGIPTRLIKVDDIPGLREGGWTSDQWCRSCIGALNSPDRVSNQRHLTALLRSLLKSMHDHVDSWPFKEPVDPRDVPDYYEVIKNPVDLKTMSKRVESEQYYVTFEMFDADVKRMFGNARTYNSPETIYYKCATRLEAHFQSKVQLAVQLGRQ